MKIFYNLGPDYRSLNRMCRKNYQVPKKFSCGELHYFAAARNEHFSTGNREKILMAVVNRRQIAFYGGVKPHTDL